jgi:hypothetical protein
VLVFPSTAICGVKLLEVELLAVTGWFRARLVVEVTLVPVRPTVSGLPGALVATDSVPVWAPPLAGAANLTLTVHEPPAAMDDPQVLVCVNGPVTLIDETEAALGPGFDTVTDCVLVDPDATSPNDRLVDDAVSDPTCTGSGKEVSTGVVLQPELPLPRLKVKAPGVYAPLL